MAQAPIHLVDLSTFRALEHTDRGALVIGFDGFPWYDGGVIGEAQHRLDWLERARVAGEDRDAELMTVRAVDWLQTLAPVDRVRVGLSWIARWHWLWNVGALEVSDFDACDLATIVFLVDEDVAKLVETSLWWTAPRGLPMDLLVEMVLWSASALFDRSDLWPRAAVVRHVDRSVDAGRDATSELIEALEHLLDAELRGSSRSRREPEHQGSAIAELIERLCPGRSDRVGLSGDRYLADGPTEPSILRITEALERLTPLSVEEWARLLLNPRTWAFPELRAAVLARVEREALLDTPEVRAALSGARASTLALEGLEQPEEVAEELRRALHRPN
jgi:hypothetical protein